MADAGRRDDAPHDDVLNIEAAPRAEDLSELRHGLNRFNLDALDGLDGEELAVFVRGPAGDLRGGIYGWTWAGWLEINQLWVRDDQRGQGLGSRLLAAAEDEGRRRGAHTCLLDTYSFQAPGFYRKHGYTAYATVEGYPTGHSKLFFRKDLRAAEDADMTG